MDKGNQFELAKITIEEFSRLQNYMLHVEDKESEAYRAMKERYIELKVILAASEVNIVALDKINE